MIALKTQPLTTSEEGGPSRVWTAILSRAALRKKGKKEWCLISIPDYCSDIETFHAVYADKTIPREVVRDAFLDHWTAVNWYLSEFPSSPRWALEAWLMTGMGTAETAERMDSSAPYLAVDVYRRAFFAVGAEQLENPGWMHRYLWGPGALHRSNRYYYDFFLKAVAFYCGPKMLEEALSGKPLSSEASTVLRNFAMGAREKMVLTDINVRNTLSGMERAPMVEAAVVEWKAEAPPAPRSHPAMEALADAIKAQVGILLPGTGTQDTYEFTSEKYGDDNAQNE